MDSDLINISLNQGKQFKNYQKKIKKGIESVEKSRRTYNKKEGFQMSSQMQSQIQMQMPMNYDGDSDNLIQKRDDRAASISKVNKAEQQQLTNLKPFWKVLNRRIIKSFLNTFNGDGELIFF